MNQARVTRLEREVARLDATERRELFRRLNLVQGVGAANDPKGETGVVGVPGDPAGVPGGGAGVSRFPGAKVSRVRRPLDPPRVQAAPRVVPGGSPTPWTEEDAPGATKGGAALEAPGEGGPVA